MVDPSVEVTPSRHGVVAKISGEMDYVTQPMLRAQLADLITRGARFLVLDLSGVSFCDSVGLAVLLRVRRQAEQSEAVLALACVPPQVRRLLTMTGLDQVFRVHDTVADAESAVEG